MSALLPEEQILFSEGRCFFRRGLMNRKANKRLQYFSPQTKFLLSHTQKIAFENNLPWNWNVVVLLSDANDLPSQNFLPWNNGKENKYSNSIYLCFQLICTRSYNALTSTITTIAELLEGNFSHFKTNSKHFQYLWRWITPFGTTMMKWIL